MTAWIVWLIVGIVATGYGVFLAKHTNSSKS